MGNNNIITSIIYSYVQKPDKKIKMKSEMENKKIEMKMRDRNSPNFMQVDRCELLVALPPGYVLEDEKMRELAGRERESFVCVRKEFWRCREGGADGGVYL
jgi:hypothetical protein